jgi:thioredoxin 1
MKQITLLAIVAISMFTMQCAPKATTATKEQTTKSKISKIEYTTDIKSAAKLTERLTASLDEGKKPVLYFHASWCGPCRSFKATIPDELVQEAMKDIDLIMVDVDKAPDLATKYGVRYIPYLVKVNKDGEVLNAITSAAWETPTPANVAIAMTDFLK